MALICLSCAWVAGIFLGSHFHLPLALVPTGLIPLCLLPGLKRHRKPIVLASLSLLALLGGVFYFQSSLPTVDENCLQFYHDQGTLEIKGMVSADPEVGDKSTHLRFSAREIKWNQEWREVSGTALVFAPRYSSYSYGDILLVTGKLESPPQLDDFDYKDYLVHQGIYSTMLYPGIEIVESGEGFKLLEWVYSVRNRLSQTLARVLPDPQASLAQGIVLGIRSNIPPPLNTDFSRSGTAHLLAISGVNLSIVAGMLVSAGIWLLGRRHYIYVWLTLAAIWLYVLLTGMHAPVVRGAIMASVFLAAELLGRQRSAITALVFAAAVMVGLSPQILWDASFQLSFLAIAGLIFVFPHLRAIGRKAVTAALGEDGMMVSIASTVADSFSVSLGAIIAVWPVVAYYFGIISLVGPLATFLALPALPGIIITGTLVGGLGFIALSAAQVIGWFAWLFLSYLLLVVEGFGNLSLSSIGVGATSATLVLAYYPALAIALWLISRRQRLAALLPQATARLKPAAGKVLALGSRLSPKWVIPSLLVVAVLASFTAATMPDDNLHVSFLDVGEGDAILIQTPDHQDILVDGGPSPQAVTLGLSQKMPFWDRSIDLVVLTHPHADHVTGLVEVLRRYQVEQVVYPALGYDSPIYDEWLSLIEEKGIKCTVAQAGQQIDLGEGAVMKVVNPRSPFLSDTESDIDNNSVVLEVSLGKVSFLLTADIEQEAEFGLITHRAVHSSTVLKVAHHGSDTSTTAEFLATVNPRLAVIPVGADNRFGHPSDEVMNRLEEKPSPESIYRTDEHGTIEFITDGERLWVKTEKRPER